MCSSHEPEGAGSIQVVEEVEFARSLPISPKDAVELAYILEEEIRRTEAWPEHYTARKSARLLWLLDLKFRLHRVATEGK
jgi:hypothetical protein